MLPWEKFVLLHRKMLFSLMFMQFIQLNKFCGSYFLVTFCFATNFVPIFCLFQRDVVSVMVNCGSLLLTKTTTHLGQFRKSTGP